MGGQFFAIRSDGTGFSRLLAGAPPNAMHYQPHVAPDGGQLLWSSTWNVEKGKAGSHTIMLADIVEQDVGFRLANVHPVVRVRDHGWYEGSAFAEDYPRDRRLYFTSSSLSLQAPRTYAAILTSDGLIEEVFKLSCPDDLLPEPFVVDVSCVGWNEFPEGLDQGRQVFFTSSSHQPIAADRFDRFLNFPPYTEGILFGLTLYNVRFAGLLDDLGYSRKSSRWISHVDGANRRLLLQTAIENGWELLRGQLVIHAGEIFFNQIHKFTPLRERKRLSRKGVFKFVAE
jgi:hypothetical protein